MDRLGGREHAGSPASSCAGYDLIGFMCGNVFQSHTCEIPPHLLAISSGHNTQQKEQSSQCLDSLDCSSAFIAAEKIRAVWSFSTANAALSISIILLPGSVCFCFSLFHCPAWFFLNCSSSSCLKFLNHLEVKNPWMRSWKSSRTQKRSRRVWRNHLSQTVLTLHVNFHWVSFYLNSILQI